MGSTKMGDGIAIENGPNIAEFNQTMKGAVSEQPGWMQIHRPERAFRPKSDGRLPQSHPRDNGPESAPVFAGS